MNHIREANHLWLLSHEFDNQDDQIYVTGIAVNKIYRVSMDGKVVRFAGSGTGKSIDDILIKASFAGPNGIASDKKNKILYISEYGRGGGIRKIQL